MHHRKKAHRLVGSLIYGHFSVECIVSNFGDAHPSNLAKSIFLGLRLVPPGHLDASRSYGLLNWQRIADSGL